MFITFALISLACPVLADDYEWAYIPARKRPCTFLLRDTVSTQLQRGYINFAGVFVCEEILSRRNSIPIDALPPKAAKEAADRARKGAFKIPNRSGTGASSPDPLVANAPASYNQAWIRLEKVYEFRNMRLVPGILDMNNWFIPDSNGIIIDMDQYLRDVKTKKISNLPDFYELPKSSGWEDEGKDAQDLEKGVRRIYNLPGRFVKRVDYEKEMEKQKEFEMEEIRKARK